MAKDISYASLKEAENSMKTFGKSFFWSKRFLPSEVAKKTALLYAFCRYVDDLADCDYAFNTLNQVQADLKAGSSTIAIVKSFLILQQQVGFPLILAEQLIQTLVKDQKGKRVQSKAELLQYAYGVASTVGLMMCYVLEVKNSHAFAFAIDMGIAMQLTNIARDVYEDALVDKIYLPQEAFSEEITPEKLLSKSEKQRQMTQQVIQELLNLADIYYQSGEDGVCYLPRKVGLAIQISATLYQAKGWQIRKHPEKYFYNRSYLNLIKTLTYTIKGAYRFYKNIKSSHPFHQANLHLDLKPLLDRLTLI